MACKPVCRLCDRLVISQAVNVTAGGTVVIDLPAGAYRNGEKYCIIVAQNIPATATIGSEVTISVGGTDIQYPLVTRCCRPVTACGIRTRTRYAVVVETTSTGGVFRLLGNTCPCPANNLASINGTAPTAPTTPAA